MPSLPTWPSGEAALEGACASAKHAKLDLETSRSLFPVLQFTITMIWLMATLYNPSPSAGCKILNGFLYCYSISDWLCGERSSAKSACR